MEAEKQKIRKDFERKEAQVDVRRKMCVCPCPELAAHACTAVRPQLGLGRGHGVASHCYCVVDARSPPVGRERVLEGEPYHQWLHPLLFDL